MSVRFAEENQQNYKRMYQELQERMVAQECYLNAAKSELERIRTEQLPQNKKDIGSSQVHTRGRATFSEASFQQTVGFVKGEKCISYKNYTLAQSERKLNLATNDDGRTFDDLQEELLQWKKKSVFFEAQALELQKQINYTQRSSTKESQDIQFWKEKYETLVEQLTILKNEKSNSMGNQEQARNSGRQEQELAFQKKKVEDLELEIKRMKEANKTQLDSQLISIQTSLISQSEEFSKEKTKYQTLERLLENERVNHQNEISEMQAQIDEMQADILILINDFQNQKKQIASMNEENQNLMSQIADLEGLIEYQQMYEKLKSDYQLLEHENKLLVGKIEDLNLRCSDLEYYQEQRNQLQKENEKVQNELAVSRRRISVIDSSLENDPSTFLLKTQVMNQQVEINSLQQKVKSKEYMIQSYAMIKEEEQNLITPLQDTNLKDDQFFNGNDQSQIFIIQNEDNQNQNNSFFLKQDQQKSKKNSMEFEVTKIQGGTRRSEASLSQPQIDLAAYQKLEVLANQTQNNLNELQKKYQDLSLKYEDLQSNLKKSQVVTELSIQNSKIITNSKSGQDDFSKLEHSYNQLQLEFNKLKEEQQNSKKLSSNQPNEYQSSNQQNADLKQKINEQEVQIKNLKDHLTAKEREISKFQKEIENLRNQNLSVSGNEESGSRSKIRQLEFEIEEKKQKIMELEDKCYSFEAYTVEFKRTVQNNDANTIKTLEKMIEEKNSMIYTMKENLTKEIKNDMVQGVYLVIFIQISKFEEQIALLEEKQKLEIQEIKDRYEKRLDCSRIQSRSSSLDNGKVNILSQEVITLAEENKSLERKAEKGEETIRLMEKELKRYLKENEQNESKLKQKYRDLEQEKKQLEKDLKEQKKKGEADFKQIINKVKEIELSSNEKDQELKQKVQQIDELKKQLVNLKK